MQILGTAVVGLLALAPTSSYAAEAPAPSHGDKAPASLTADGPTRETTDSRGRSGSEPAPVAALDLAAATVISQLHDLDDPPTARIRQSKFLSFAQALLRPAARFDGRASDGEAGAPNRHEYSRTTSRSSGDRDLAPLSEALSRPVATLKEACGEDNPDALFMMAEMSFHGNFTYPRSFEDALYYYERLALLTGNATAHSQVALLHSTGLGVQDQVADQAMAQLHHTAAANQGDVRSQMALGYRHLNGIGTPPNCTLACKWYSKAADQALDWMRDGPPGGKYWVKRGYHFDEDYGGLFGSTPTLPYHGAVVLDSEDIDDVLDYLTYLAEKGEVSACFQLAKIYSDGSRTIKQDAVKSLYWFRQVAKTYWMKDGRLVKNAKAMRYHAKTAAYIATAYLRGEGVDQDFEKAKKWFHRGIALGDATAQNGMGLMHLDGLGPAEKSLVKAEEFFKAAADQDHKTAQLNLAKLYAARGDVVPASRLFESAARAGRVEAFYYLAQFSEHGVGREKNCNMATHYYKLVAESVEDMHSTVPYGNAAYRRGDIDDAILAMLIAAESGYELGQVNLAFLLDKHRTRLGLRERYSKLLKDAWRAVGLRAPIASRSWRLDENSQLPRQLRDMSDELALRYYSRAAAQSNFEALVKAGDYHYEGLGARSSHAKAVEMWTAAADTRIVPLALWNLGWSYENGKGVEQDFHLAKRYYDACLEQEPRAYLPVTISLLKLRARSAWNTIIGGSVRSIKDEEEVPAKASWSSVWQGLRHFWKSQWDVLDDNHGHDHEHDDGGAGGDEVFHFLEDDYPDSDDDLF